MNPVRQLGRQRIVAKHIVENDLGSIQRHEADERGDGQCDQRDAQHPAIFANESPELDQQLEECPRSLVLFAMIVAMDRYRRIGTARIAVLDSSLETRAVIPIAPST